MAKLNIVLSWGVVILLTLMVVMGTIQIIQNTRKYGVSYEVITITNGEEVSTTMTVWVNVAFMVFLSLIIYLLVLPLQGYHSKKEE